MLIVWLSESIWNDTINITKSEFSIGIEHEKWLKIIGIDNWVGEWHFAMLFNVSHIYRERNHYADIVIFSLLIIIFLGCRRWLLELKAILCFKKTEWHTTIW
jgi:hypothetical protein